MPKRFQGLLFFSGLMLTLIFVSLLFNPMSQDALEYGEFVRHVQSGDVKDVVVSGNGYEITGEYKKDEETPYQEFLVYYRPNMDPGPEKLLLDENIPFRVEKPETYSWFTLILSSLPYVFMVFIAIMLLRAFSEGSGGQAFSFGKSRHALVSEEDISVRFDDVAGVEEAKNELSEVVDYLRHPKKYQEVGARIPRGLLLVGSPGTGKTLLARAVAGEAGVPFYFISGSDFVEMFVGVGASRVRDLFEQAQKTSPCLIFIDEIDAVGRKRGAGLGGGHDEREQTLNQLLVAMDGFESNDSVIVLAATNRPDVLDPALLRPGRFDRRVMVDKPDIAGREAILQVHSKGKPLGKDVDLEVIARNTAQFSGADLENVLNEAALEAARSNRKVIQMQDCWEAIDRVQMGPQKKSRVMSEKEKERTAYHEAGHAIVAWFLEHADSVTKVTILPRGMALGVTNIVPDEDRYGYTKTELLAHIAVLMAGRAAEEIIYNEYTTGASNDIERATGIARDMVTRYGMSELGPLNFSGGQEVFIGRDFHETKSFSEHMGEEIDKSVSLLVQGQYEEAKSLLQERSEELERVRTALLDKEVLSAYELEDLIGAPVGKSVMGRPPEESIEEEPVDNESKEDLSHSEAVADSSEEKAIDGEEPELKEETGQD